jgi:hypothetical protein
MARGSMDDLGWVFRRTLIFFVTTIGSIFIGFMGIVLFISGLFSGNGWAIFLGITLGLTGLFFRIFAKRMDRWLGIKNM